jgi:hypothetical protein
MGLGNVSHERQAQSSARYRAVFGHVRPIELFENARLLAGGNSDSVILDLNHGISILRE